MGKGARHRNERKAVSSNVTVTQKSSVWKKVMTAAAAVLICAVVLVTLVYSAVRDSGTIMKLTTAMTVGGQKITADELEFYYKSVVKMYENNNSYYEALYGIKNFYGIDFSKDLFKQKYNDSQSWGQFFREEAVERLYNVLILYQDAQKAGYTLTDDMKKSVDETIDTLKESAESYDVSVKYLLKLNYGNAITLDKYRFYLEREEIVSKYSQDIFDGFEITAEQKAAKYAEDPSAYDRVNYYVLSYTPDIEEDSDETIDSLKEKILGELSKLDSLEKFKEYGKDLTATTDDEGNPVEGKEATLNSNVAKASLGEEMAEWMYASGRKEGDVNVFSGTSTLTLVYFVNRDDLDYPTRSLRHILLQSEEEDEEVLKELQDIYDDWKAGIKTEESFGVYADSHSDDKSTEGGLYTEVYKGQLYTEIDEWLFDEARKPGDTEIVFTEDAGYHLLYYVGEGDTYRDVLTDNDLRNEDYEEFLKALKALKPIVRNERGIKRVK